MRKHVILASLVLTVLAFGFLRAAWAEEEDDPGAPVVKLTLQQKINEAIKRGVGWLKQAQRDDGSWGPCHGDKRYDSDKPGGDCHYSGPTSFAIFTLSKCDVPQKDPVIAKGMDYLRKTRRYTQMWTDPKTERGNRIKKGPVQLDSYEIASLIMMLETLHERSEKITKPKRKKRGKRVKPKPRLHSDNPLVPPKKSKFLKDRKHGKQDWLWMHEGIRHLIGKIVRTNKKHNKRINVPGRMGPGGGWRYGQMPKQIDTSATQFVLLGLRSASQAGYPVPHRVWQTSLKALKSLQLKDGTFCYRRGEKMSAGMTAAGVASALICKEQLLLADQPVPAFTDSLIKSGMEQIDKLFDVGKNQGFRGAGGAYHYYYLYGIERVGDLTGRSEFNGKNWYVRGARYLLNNQDVGNGRWVDATCMKPRDVLGTCFALLFLKRATVPTVTSSGN